VPQELPGYRGGEEVGFSAVAAADPGQGYGPADLPDGGGVVEEHLVDLGDLVDTVDEGPDGGHDLADHR
jgi:hypothetical protein